MPMWLHYRSDIRIVQGCSVVKPIWIITDSKIPPIGYLMKRACHDSPWNAKHNPDLYSKATVLGVVRGGGTDALQCDEARAVYVLHKLLDS